jgi:hypothetical protein
MIHFFASLGCGAWAEELLGHMVTLCLPCGSTFALFSTWPILVFQNFLHVLFSEVN